MITSPETYWINDETGNALALVVSSSFSTPGVSFLTPDSFGQQIAVMNRPKGEIIQSHTHLPVSRDLVGTQEVLLIKTGKVRVDLYNNDQSYVTSVNLHSGDLILLCGGGHGFEMIENSSFVEVKQGPFTPGGDKELFPETHEGKINYWVPDVA